MEINESIRAAAGKPIGADQAAGEVNLEQLIAERDKAVSALQEEKELACLRSLGVKDEDLDYQRYKINKEKDNGQSFEEYAEKHIRPVNRRYRVVTSSTAAEPELDPIRQGIKDSYKKSAALMARLSGGKR